MKSIKYIVTFVAVIAIGQINYCAQQASPQQIAYRLTQESYITPEMQWAVLSLFDAQDMTINTKTGAVQGIQSVEFMLNFIEKKLESSISFATKESMKNALHAMLEATDLAIFVAAVEAAYSNQMYIMYQEVNSELSTLLTEQKNRIHNAISYVNGTVPYDQPATSMSSYFSWFGSSSSTAMSSYIEPLHFNDKNNGDEFITIPANLVQAIITKNDYKLENNPKEAAELLFKECFIAQQHHLKDRVDKLKIKLHSPLRANNYIFTYFHSIHDTCEIAKKMVSSHHKRIDLQAPVTKEHMAAHKLLLDIRQAVQTALYIANAKSTYNIGYILPASVTAYLNGVVSELLQYDTQLDALCKAPEYGAMQDDIYRDEQWAMITKVAAGTVAVAALTGGLFIVGVLPAVGSLITGTAGTATAVKGAAALTTAQTIWNAGAEAKKYTDTIGYVGKKVATAGGALALGAQVVKGADAQGYISLNDIDIAARDITGLDINSRDFVDFSQKLGTGAAMVGGAGVLIRGTGNAIAGVATAVNDIPNAEEIFWSTKVKKDVNGQEMRDIEGDLVYKNSVVGDIYDAFTGAKNAQQVGTNAAQNAIGLGTVALSAATQFTGTNNPAISQTQKSQALTDQISPQIITNVFTKFINDGVTENGLTPLNKIATASQNLLQEKKTTPANLVSALQNVQQNILKSNSATPEIAQGLNQITQKVASLVQ